LEDSPGIDLHFSQAGLAVKAGAFIKITLMDDKSLGEGLGIVRVGLNDFIGHLGGQDVRD
jgi:formyltetrahydrofolate synthetase